MGIFEFIKNIGKAVGIGNEAEEIQAEIQQKLAGQVEELTVTYAEGTVILTGTVADQAAREKAVLLAGNVQGVEKVDDRLTIRAPEPVFYTIQKGDTLSKIAREHYGDASKWKALFEANREVIEDPDLIYPGQRIRIPQDL
ncbi:peptidoglycan-binding protein LysM [Rhodocaloribacter litoris]|uniref:peptidoglycan-binding protein LysM n=1 Tax=Rhodocaloribacter litoris TaxID=2558931 RepID=UPI0014202B77|nr:peptidoglycan-binding protein LysM [Rhodocaloribacter litoris]QXD17047.1 peptidoglycan-binding protein LysM [Rhodocaloribacter litoris]